LKKLKKIKEVKTNLDKVLDYVNETFYESTITFANNDKIVRKDSDANYLQFTLIGRMMFISELKRFINYIKKEEEK